MNFKEHSNLRGLHAFLGASTYHWTNYTPEKLTRVFKTYQAKQRGTEMHDLAESLIKLKIRLPDNGNAFNMFVNDAIGFRMTPEQPLLYSVNSFGTADAISLKDKVLRIHDLKTGSTKVSMRQLEVYAALFCLEYDVSPETIDIELRIYQGSEIIVHEPEPSDITTIMNTIVEFDRIIEQIKLELE